MIEVPRYNPNSVLRSTLTSGTFEQAYDSLVSLTDGPGSDVVRGGDMSDKILSGRPETVIGQQFVITDNQDLETPEKLIAIRLNKRGVNLFAEEVEATRLPGYPIGYISFSKETPHARLNGWVTYLDSKNVHVGGEWHLDEEFSTARGAFSQFAGRIGLRGFLFGKKGLLGEAVKNPEFETYLREGAGRNLSAALMKIVQKQGADA